MLTTRFHQAFAYAARHHHDQKRKGTQIPYLSHLMGVASLVMEAAADGHDHLPEGYEDLVIAALLHDVVEDCGGPPRLEEVRERFGERVASIVDHCSDGQPAPGEQKAPWPERKQRYLARLRDGNDPRPVMVSAADKIHNARAIVADLRAFAAAGRSQDEFWMRFVTDKPGADLDSQVPQILWYYQAVAGAVEQQAAKQSLHHGVGRLARELRAAVDDMHSLAARSGYQPARF